MEHIWALLLSTVRYITVEDTNVKGGNSQWQSTMPMGLAGQTLGLVGVGRLGTQTAAASDNYVWHALRIQIDAIVAYLDREGFRQESHRLVATFDARAREHCWCGVHRDEGSAVQAE